MGKNDTLIIAGAILGAVFIFRKEIGDTFGGVSTATQGLGEGIASISEDISDVTEDITSVTGGVSDVVEDVTDITGATSNLATTIIDETSQSVGGLFDAGQDIVGGIYNTGAKGLNWIIESGQNIFDGKTEETISQTQVSQIDPVLEKKLFGREGLPSPLTPNMVEAIATATTKKGSRSSRKRKTYSTPIKKFKAQAKGTDAVSKKIASNLSKLGW